MPKRTRRGIVGPSPRWTTFPAACRVASMVAGANRSFRWKRGFEVRDRCCRSWTTHPLYGSLEDVTSFGRRLDQVLDVVQQKSQRSMTKIFLVILLIVPVLAMRRRLALIGRRIVLEPKPLAGRSITLLARRMPKRTQKGIVGLSPRWTSVCRIIVWMQRTWLDRRSSSEGNRRTIAYRDQLKQDHVLDCRLYGPAYAGTSSAGPSPKQEHLLEQQQHASKVTKPQAAKKGGGGGNSPPVTQKTTALQPPEPWIGMWLDGDRRRLG